MRQGHAKLVNSGRDFNPRTPRGVRRSRRPRDTGGHYISIHAPREGCDPEGGRAILTTGISIHAPREGCDVILLSVETEEANFNPRTPRGVRRIVWQHWRELMGISIHAPREGCDSLSYLVFWRMIISIHAPREGCDPRRYDPQGERQNFNPRTPRGVRQQTLLKSREFAWLNLLICTRGRRLSIQKQTRLCSIKLSFMLFGCEPAGEGVSSWTSHATKSKVRLEGRSAYSQSVRSSAHSDFPGNKSGGCPVRDP